MNPSPLPAANARPPLAKETTVGNYFVSNYPPFAFWKPECVPEFLAAIERRPGTRTNPPPSLLPTSLFASPAPAAVESPLGVYVHIPFCRKRCHFCYFKVYTDKDSQEIRSYLDALLRELTLFAGNQFVGWPEASVRVLRRRVPPSYLSVDQLRFLFDGLKRLLPSGTRSRK